MTFPQVQCNAGEPLPVKRTWLGDVVASLLKAAEIKGLKPKKPSEPSTPGPEQAVITQWTEGIQMFWVFLERHLKALCDVCVLAKEVRNLSSDAKYQILVENNI